ncbi:Excision repair cross-complementation group 1 [Mactra antiquata]
MSSKKFVIPSIDDIEGEETDQAKQFSKFRNFSSNKNQRNTVTTEVKKPGTTSIQTTTKALCHSGASSSLSNVSKSSTASLYSIANVSSSTTPSSTPTSIGTESTSKLSSNQPVQGPSPSVSKPASANSIIVNFRQRGNPILKHIKNVPWEYGSIVPDYVMGVANCALFLSLRYHQLHPEYLHNRLKELGKGYDLRVLLVQVDVKESHTLLKDLAKMCILADMTLILAFSAEEVGRYLEAYKVYENKPAEALMEKVETDYVSQLTECLTTVKSVNKTDCMTLLSTFKTMDGVINASKSDVSCCAGFGPQKANRIYDVFHEPFLKCWKRKNDTAESCNGYSVKKKPR